MTTLHDDATFVCLCRRCVREDPNTVFNVALAAPGKSPVGAHGSRADLRAKRTPRHSVLAQRTPPRESSFGYGHRGEGARIAALLDAAGRKPSEPDLSN